MRRILLVIDDYQELSSFQTLLMKFGWDVKGVKRDLMVAEELLSFSPEIVISALKGRHIDGKKLCQRLKRDLNGPAVFLVVDRMSEVNQLDPSSLDGFFLRPVDMKTVVRSLGKFAGDRKRLIIERFEKIFGEPFREDEYFSYDRDISEREENYYDIVSSVNLDQSQVWDREKIDAARRKVRDQATSDSDESRQDFVKKLFRK